MKRSIKRILLYLGITLGAASLAITEEAKEKERRFSFGYNALENAALHDAALHEKKLRTRNYTNIAMRINKAELAYEGFNEADDFTPSSYFGRHVLALGKNKGNLQAAIMLKSAYGENTLRAGVRSKGLAAWLRGYGYGEATLSSENLSTSLFFGKAFGEKGSTSLELFHVTDLSFSGKRSHYTELQANQDVWEITWIRKPLGFFTRAEFDNFNPKGRYLFGLAVKKYPD